MSRRVLFLQCTNAGQYPPILNAAMLFADRGWQVTILSSPSKDTAVLAVEEHPRVTHVKVPMRSQNAIRPSDYVKYVLASAKQALWFRPAVIYASDPAGALPALIASKLRGARIVYHEHDSPAAGSLRPWLARMRAAAVAAADHVVIPNEARAELVQGELGFPAERLSVVWNLPRRTELPALAAKAETPLVLYYHGSITPDRLPEAVVEAVMRFRGRIRLRIAGYEAPGARGYIARLLSLNQASNGGPLIQYIGQIQRMDLLKEAAQAHVGLALMPRDSTNLNMRHMTGASNKAFDYMAAGLALLVSDLDDWQRMFVTGGFALSCDPADPGSIATALGRFLDDAVGREAMAARGRAKIEQDWNYETAFAPVIDALDATYGNASGLLEPFAEIAGSPK